MSMLIPCTVTVLFLRVFGVVLEMIDVFRGILTWSLCV